MLHTQHIFRHGARCGIRFIAVTGRNTALPLWHPPALGINTIPTTRTVQNVYDDTPVLCAVSL